MPGSSKHILNTKAVQFYRTAHLFSSVSHLRYVSEGRKELLAKLNISSIDELFWHVPFRYLDFTKVTSIQSAKIGEEVTLIGEVYNVELKSPRPRLHIVEVTLQDESGIVIISFFKQPWIAEQIKEGMRLVVSGKIGFNYGFKRLSSPFFEVLDSGDEGHTKRIMMLPIHHSTEGLSNAWMRRIISSALDDYTQLRDHLPVEIRARRLLMSYQRALRCIHFPNSYEQAQEARERLAYDEVFQLQLALRLRREHLHEDVIATSHDIDGPHAKALLASLPFELSSDQRAAVDDIYKLMHRDKPMNHMLLGDVGTGKTAVALLALGPVCDSQKQAAMMAPTTVLAEQYAKKMGASLDAAHISWALLTSATPKDEREKILAALKSGALHVLFGTHALIQEDVEFKNLSLAIVDEQHRFGVAQRTALRQKGPGADLLLMSATPIPRTLALSIYGDLSCSYLYKRPVKGAGVSSKVLKKSDRGIAYDAIKEALSKGFQAYIICPLVGTKSSDENLDDEIINAERSENLKAANQEAEFLQKKVFIDYKVGLLTGALSQDEKHQVMQDFENKKIDVLVATTVVEVGVDVPNATVMIIEDAERFGLAQLHQLRGRVGRGKNPGQVFFLADSRSGNASARLSALEQTSDGFKLAELDLIQRKEGDLMGTRQSGDPQLKLVDFAKDKELIAQAHFDALDILQKDPKLVLAKHRGLRLRIAHRFKQVFTEVVG